jgi:hypothetical protein
LDGDAQMAASDGYCRRRTGWRRRFRKLGLDSLERKVEGGEGNLLSTSEELGEAWNAGDGRQPWLGLHKRENQKENRRR